MLREQQLVEIVEGVLVRQQRTDPKKIGLDVARAVSRKAAAERERLMEKIKALEDHSERMEAGIGIAKLYLDQGYVADVRKALAYATEKSGAVVAAYSKDRLHPEAGEGG